MANFEQYFSQFLKTVKDDDIPSIVPLLLIHKGRLLRDEDAYSLSYTWLDAYCELYIRGDNWDIYKEENGNRYFVLDPDNDLVIREVKKIGEIEVGFDDEEPDIETYPFSDYCGEVENSLQDNEQGLGIIHAWFQLKK